MQREVIVTNDGSHSISIPELNVTYHSKHGAIQESTHVFIRSGLDYVSENLSATPIKIFEVGFGTGLNALLTFQYAALNNLDIEYTAVELFPLQSGEINELNYASQMEEEEAMHVFTKLHAAPWEIKSPVTPHFILQKLKRSLLDPSLISPGSIDLVYFDAFAPAAQPELWSREAFEIIHTLMTKDGVMVTYCSKSIARKAMTDAGFRVTKIPGPPGKREIVRAFAS
jgi:tRNA U34 5-methylaminomethyl-2-thiouridine-forming methyltransferase MnmC